MGVGQRIKALRLERGLTQTALAEPAYTPAYVSTIESGKRNPSGQVLEHFAKKLGIETDELLTGRSPGQRARLLIEYAEARKILASGASDSIKQAENRFTKLVRKARSSGFNDIEAKARVGIGLCAEAKNDLDQAVLVYEETLQLLQDESPVTRVDAVVGRARALQTKGEIALAAFLIEQAIAELRTLEIEDPSSLLRLNASLVAAYFDAGLIDRAMAAADIALDLAAHVEDPERLANMNLNVGIMLSQHGHWREAEVRLAEAERWFNEAQYATDLARVRLVRGINLRNQERFDEARPHLVAAQQTFALAGNALREARASVALGVLERSAGRQDEAKFVLKRAIALAGDDLGVAGIAHRELALCEEDGDRQSAIKGLRKAVGLLERAGIVKELATTYRKLGDLMSNDQELMTACEAYRKAADLYEQAA